MPEQIMLFVASLFKGITLNKEMRIGHESQRHSETRILKCHGYIPLSRNKYYIVFYSYRYRNEVRINQFHY